MVAAKKTLPVLATLVTFVAIVIMLKLGFWQLDRMAAKQLRLDSLTQRQALAPMPLTEALQQTFELEDIPVRFKASVDTNRLIYLDNRIVNGVVGYEIYAIAETNVGEVLVNFGWLKAGDRRDALPDIEFNTPPEYWQGNIVQPRLNPVTKETLSTISTFPIVVQQIDIPLLNRLLAESLQPFVVALSDTQEPFVNNWKPVVMSPEKHLGYAIQWFGLALAAFIVFIVAFVKRKKSRD